MILGPLAELVRRLRLAVFVRRDRAGIVTERKPL